MFKVYDTNHNFLLLLDQCRNLFITESIETGTKNLCFQVPVLDKYIANIQEEFYIESQDYSYVVKEISMKDNQFFTVRCIANYEDLAGTLHKVFDGFQLSIRQTYQQVCALTEWTVSYSSSNHTVIDLQEANKTCLELIRILAENYDQELWFDTKNKVLYVYDQMGNQLGNYYSNELKLQTLNKQSDTYEYATVLYPYGKDGLDIKTINSNKDYITNFNYSNKYIERVWVDEKFEYAEDLKKYAQLYLEELAQPKCSYKLKLAELGQCQLGDQITLIDKLKRIKQKQRVVKIVRYPFEPERDQVELSNLKSSFAKLYKDYMRKQQADIEYIKNQIKEMNLNP